MPKDTMPIVIAGAGPAGSSLAIRLTRLGLSVKLIERFKFPRQKLCGEFISPECLEHFRELDCLDAIIEAGGDRVTETKFYEVGGRPVAVPSSWFSGGGFAVSLSRARMDLILLEKARANGAEVLDETSVTGLLIEGGKVAGVKIRSTGSSTEEIAAGLVVDATGRGRVLAGSIDKDKPTPARPKFIGFKAHLSSVDMPKGVCEIYAFRGGYAGLSHIEDGLANLCFLAKASLLKRFKGPDEIVEHLRSVNKRAAQTLASVSRNEDWHAVSVPRFGTHDAPTISGLITVGDSAAFVDPFTGSGMLLAMEAAALFADIVSQHGLDPGLIGEVYRAAFREQFSPRLRTSGVIRAVAYEPIFSTAVVRVLSLNDGLSAALARRTRSEHPRRIW
jgi:flavin-dependent dehydrogenase